jgi:hypothetical protein
MDLKMKKTLILPDDILTIIREFSRPIGLRLDWRTCKRKESRRIKMSDRALREWYRWIIGRDQIHPLYEEIKDWSFYGRRHLILESRRRFWSTGLSEEPTENDREWYEKKYICIAADYPVQMLTLNTIESHMWQYPLVL